MDRLDIIIDRLEQVTKQNGLYIGTDSGGDLTLTKKKTMPASEVFKAALSHISDATKEQEVSPEMVGRLITVGEEFYKKYEQKTQKPWRRFLSAISSRFSKNENKYIEAEIKTREAYNTYIKTVSQLGSLERREGPKLFSLGRMIDRKNNFARYAQQNKPQPLCQPGKIVDLGQYRFNK